jgi:hypothetical protein
MPGPKQHIAAIGIGRQVTLIEAGIAALLIHGALYLLLLALGLLGLFVDAIPERAEEPEMHFTFAPAVETAAAEEAAAPGTVPGAPQPAPEPDARTSAEPLDQTPPPSPPIAALPPISATPPLPVEQASDSPQTEAPSEGAVDAAEEVTEAYKDPVESEALPAEELFEAETKDAADDVLEARDESFLPEADAGELGTLRQPAARAPAPSPGRPDGPSVDQRISDFGRALERTRDRTVASRPQQPRNTFEPDWASLPTTGQAIGNLTFESGDYDWSDYSRQIYFIIWRAWHNRLLARADDFEKWAQQNSIFMLDHINGVRFTIEGNGQIVDIVLERDSGSEPFDLSSIEGLDEALLPPLPADFPRATETVHVFFIGQGPVGSMRRALLEYKRAGWF